MDISNDTTMQELLSIYPSAKRTLFSQYHIGGCSSCAYDNNDTIEKVSEKHDFNLKEAIAHILQSHEHDEQMMLTPQTAKAKLKNGAKLIDLRTREEFEQVKIAQPLFFTQELQQEIFANWEPNTEIIIYDHLGSKALDTCAWFRGHGLNNTFIIKGGIDAWSQEVDPSISRYRLEFE